MKKPSNFNKITHLPATPPDTAQTPPIEARESQHESNKIHQSTNQQAGFTGELTIRIPKTLHKELSAQAAEEGITLPEYILYMLSQV